MHKSNEGKIVFFCVLDNNTPGLNAMTLQYKHDIKILKLFTRRQ